MDYPATAPARGRNTAASTVSTCWPPCAPSTSRWACSRSGRLATKRGASIAAYGKASDSTPPCARAASDATTIRRGGCERCSLRRSCACSSTPSYFRRDYTRAAASCATPRGTEPSRRRLSELRPGMLAPHAKDDQAHRQLAHQRQLADDRQTEE